MSQSNLIVFVSSFKGVSKKNGKDYQRVSFMDVSGRGAFQKDFFVSPALDLTKFKFGDIVSVSFVPSPFLGGQPVLDSVELLENSPYLK